MAEEEKAPKEIKEETNTTTELPSEELEATASEKEETPIDQTAIDEAENNDQILDTDNPIKEEEVSPAPEVEIVEKSEATTASEKSSNHFEDDEEFDFDSEGFDDEYSSKDRAAMEKLYEDTLTE
ncbi:MAG: hypothetical protein AAF789_15375, partial [Bacteroidota bacterium]